MNEQLLIKNIAEIGKLLLKNGAEIYRVEESLERMCQSYGFQDIGVFALPTYFTMSVTFQDGTNTSLTKRTLQNRTNLDAVCALNDLVRKICNESGLAKADGHELASGIEIKKELLNEFTIYIEETLPELKDDSTTNIDIQLDISDITRKMVDLIKRFDRISEARKIKILDGIRLLENCSNKSNYEYTNDEIENIFADIEKALHSAKAKFTADTKQQRIDMFKSEFEREYTWLNGFMRNVYRFADKEAMISPETKTAWTYSELNSEANRFSNAILDAGIIKGGVVMFQLLNCPEFAFAYIACHKTGTVSCPINFRLSAGEIAITIEDSRPTVFIYESINKDAVEQALKLSKFTPKMIIMVDEEGAAPIPGTVKYSDFVKNASAENPNLNWNLSIYDETTRLYTSGTTGRPKGVCITSINEVLSAHDVMIHFPFSSEDKSMNTTPWFHRGGLHSGGLTPTFYAGGCVTIMRKFDAALTLKYVEDYKLSFIIGVPAVLERLTEAQERNGRDLSTLHGIVTMGSPLERAACMRYQRVLTPRIFNGYGTTETFWNTFLRPNDLPEMAGTAGRACTDDDVRVVKVFEDRRAEPHEIVAKDNCEVGEVIIRSHAKSAYFYYNNEGETERKFHNGYLYTNDLGTWDENHFITIAGRKDDMIISQGENIYPTQIEEVLNSHPKVADSIVTAVPDKAHGEIVTAYVVKADESLTVDELEEFCKNSPMISNYKRPRYYRFTATIPTNVTGKKLHYKIKEMAKNDLINGLLIRA